MLKNPRKQSGGNKTPAPEGQKFLFEIKVAKGGVGVGMHSPGGLYTQGSELLTPSSLCSPDLRLLSQDWNVPQKVGILTGKAQ